MSRQGMIAAKVHGEELPAFANAMIASESLTSYKNETLSAFARELFPGVEPTFTPASLKEIEAWYFSSSCPALGKEGCSIPHAIGFFFGEVLCRNAGFSRVVQEYAFRPGCYEIGVNKGLLFIMLTKGRRLTLDRNTRKWCLLIAHRDGLGVPVGTVIDVEGLLGTLYQSLSHWLGAEAALYGASLARPTMLSS